MCPWLGLAIAVAGTVAVRRDMLWNYLAIDHHERLVLAQGWPLQRYTQWLAHAISSAICP